MNAFVTIAPFVGGSSKLVHRRVPRRCCPSRAATRCQPCASVNWSSLSRRARETLSSLTQSTTPATYAAKLQESVDADPKNPFMWHALAKHLASDPEAAIAVLKKAVETVPVGGRGGLFDFWGTLELRRDNLESALSIFSIGLEADPYTPLYISRANALADVGRIEEAHETFRTATSLIPRQASLWRAWAMLESHCGKPESAREKFRVAVEMNKLDVRAWRMLIRAEEKCGAGQTAMADVLRRAIASCPNDASFRLQLAQIEENRKAPGIAKSILQFSGAESNVLVLRALAKLEARQSNFERARELFRKAANFEASEIKSHTGPSRKFKRRLKKETTAKSLHAWALMEARIGNVASARAILDEALSASPADAAIWRAIGELESREKNYDQARKAFKNAVALSPQDFRLLLAWGKTESLAGEVSRAEKLIQRVAEIVPMHGTGWNDTTEEPSSVSNLGVTPVQAGELEDDGLSASSPSRNFEDDNGSNVSPHVVADALREWAVLAAREGRFDDAVALFTRACEMEPGHAAGWRLLASQVLRLKGIDATRQVYERGIAHVAFSAQAKLLHWWGQEEKSNGNFDEARNLFRRATCANPAYMSAWLSWGLMEKGVGELETACKIFEEASVKAERDVVRAPFVFQAWGRVEELQRGRAEVAAEIFRRGVNVVPRSGSLWTAWGLLEERRGNVAKAREYFEKATSVEPTHGSAWHSWALLEARRCKYERAANLFRKGNEYEPTNSSLLASWAMMEGKELSNIERGRDLFTRATAADPLYSPAWHSWGCMEMNAGNYEEARKLFLKSVSLRPTDPSPLHSLGILEAEHCNNNVTAIEHWQKAISVCPGHALSYQSWALLEGRTRGNLIEARRLFETGITCEQQSAADVGMLLQSWATLEQHHGNIEQARELLRKALDIERRRAETWLSLALIEKSRGNRDGARKLLEDGVEIVRPAVSAAPLFVAWATVEAEEGDIESARDLFARGVRANPSNSTTWKCYASVEAKYGSPDRAAEIRMSGELFVTNDGHDACPSS